MTTNVITLEIPAQQRFANVACACVGAMLERVTEGTHTAQLSHDVQLAVQEMVTNIIDHAYDTVTDNDNRNRISFRLVWEAGPRRFSVDMCDSGRPFETDSVPTSHWRQVPSGAGVRHELAEVEEPSWDQEGGRGFFLLLNLADQVIYERLDGANHWQLTKCL